MIDYQNKAAKLGRTIFDDNYPTRTAQDLEIADLKRENNAAFERIQELSAELVRLGFDPTAKRQ
jgi:hypothetical protein